MSNIQDQIQAAASRFATEVVSLLKGATLSEITSLTGRPATGDSARAPRGARALRGPGGAPPRSVEKPRRRGRAAGKKRSREEVARLADRVMDFLKSQKEDVGVSEIASALHVATGDLGLPLSKLRTEDRIKTRGQKRSTVYRLA